MADDFLPVDGLIVPANALTLPRARGIAEISGSESLPFVRLVECRRVTLPDGGGSSETVVIDVVVERPQVPVHDMRHEERLAIVFQSADSSYPKALALRPDFPRVPHLNFTDREFPRSLCLYDRPWSEVALRWTPAVFIERVRHWLAQTAKGTLHQQDQPLEPLLFDSGLRIVLPADAYANLAAEQPVQLDVRPASATDDCRTLIAHMPKGEGDRSPLRYVATTFAASPQAHGIIRRSPANIAELHEFLVAGGIDLIGSLRGHLPDWDKSNLLCLQLIIIVALPLTRVPSSSPEAWNVWAFLTLTSVRDVGIEIGCWADHNGKMGLLVPPNDELRGQSVPVVLLIPYIEFTRTGAAATNGVSADPCKVVAVGAGALGSQVITGLKRSGFGTWTIVDEDDLLPHNLGRHALDGFYVGQSKAVSMAFYLDQLYRNGEGSTAIAADVLSPGSRAGALGEAFTSAELILDMSASVPVARHVANNIDSSARRISLFVNPQGTDLVVLAEDKGRRIPLDSLEIQYYRAAAADSRLEGHLAANPGRLRYGRTCRDITTSMPGHLVTLHAAIASQAVRSVHESDAASIRIWRCDPAALTVAAVEITPSNLLRQEMLGWTLNLDQWLLQRLAELRAGKLPNETGGVLIGTYDLQRKCIYVVDTIPSPPDSKEWPVLYIRGCEGLLAKVQEISDRTAGQLEYVGEWHSHPDGHPTRPSPDDMKVFAWLTDHLAVAGVPALMAIVGEEVSSSWYIGEMLPSGGWGVSA